MNPDNLIEECRCLEALQRLVEAVEEKEETLRVGTCSLWETFE